MSRIAGPVGEVRAGVRVAAHLGPWQLMPAGAGETLDAGRGVVTAHAWARDEFLLDGGQLTLALPFGTAERVYRIVRADFASAPASIEIELHEE